VANADRQQDVAYDRVKDMHPDNIRCRYCGEQTASNDGWKGYAHRYGPTRHRFIAATPKVSADKTDNS
jgi:hypothetical protein